MHKPEIDDLVARFRAELIAESQKYRGSKAVGAIGAFIVAIEAHRVHYAKKLAAIRVNADAVTDHLGNETELMIDAMVQREIQRVRTAGCVELNPELCNDQQPPQSDRPDELIRETQNVAPVGPEIVEEESGAEKYVSPDRREQRSDIERIMFLEEDQPESVAKNLHVAIESVASMSSEKIDRVISNALEGLRNIMPNEGERVIHDNHQLRQSEPRGNGDGAA